MVRMNQSGHASYLLHASASKWEQTAAKQLIRHSKWRAHKDSGACDIGLSDDCHQPLPEATENLAITRDSVLLGRPPCNSHVTLCCASSDYSATREHVSSTPTINCWNFGLTRHSTSRACKPDSHAPQSTELNPVSPHILLLSTIEQGSRTVPGSRREILPRRLIGECDGEKQLVQPYPLCMRLSRRMPLGQSPILFGLSPSTLSTSLDDGTRPDSTHLPMPFAHGREEQTKIQMALCRTSRVFGAPFPTYQQARRQFMGLASQPWLPTACKQSRTAYQWDVRNRRWLLSPSCPTLRFPEPLMWLSHCHVIRITASSVRGIYILHHLDHPFDCFEPPNLPQNPSFAVSQTSEQNSLPSPNLESDIRDPVKAEECHSRNTDASTQRKTITARPAQEKKTSGSICLPKSPTSPSHQTSTIISNTTPSSYLPGTIFAMCQYYAHVFACKHLTFAFARFCHPASLIQKPCSKRQIWQTIHLEEACEECIMWFPDKFPVKSCISKNEKGGKIKERKRRLGFDDDET
ncbi:hypothetical protein ACRALDRAFT_205513 [Sodiomyces alcalophilus JCM 7366]|uniref:uncharacterized protein n=1 Tax=Sodiomyces alcalophilus JCM 7366 TaxID=591952 RepID=UPI0039B499E3